MAYRDILLPVLGGVLHDSAIRVATALARLAPGRVKTVAIADCTQPVSTAWSYCPAELLTTLEQQAAAEMQSVAARVRERFSRQSVEYEVVCARSLWHPAEDLVREHAWFADLVIMGLSRPLMPESERIVGYVLAGCGRPVVFVPENFVVGRSFDRISILWTDSRCAARALHEAVPALHAARTVELVTMLDANVPGETAPRLKELATHLGRHAIESRTVVLTKEQSINAGVLDHYFLSSPPDLIVAGAGLTLRARGQRLGLRTRELLEHAPCPVLLAH